MYDSSSACWYTHHLLLSNIMIIINYLMLVIFLLLYTKSNGEMITVTTNYNSQTATTINNVGSIISSHDQVRLDNGVHSLNKSLVLNNLTNITIYGSSANNTTISCASKVGIAVFNVDTLVIHNVTFLHCGAQANETGFLREANDLSPVSIPSDVIIGLLIADSKNLLLSQVTINGTDGLGMLVMNVMGFVHIISSNFVNNRSPQCYPILQNRQLHRDYVGGGITFIYEDDDYVFHNSSVTVTLLNCNFRNNQGCTNNGIVGLYHQYSPTLEEVGYVIGEGGLTLMSSQLSYKLKFTVSLCVFSNNVGRFGSALAFLFFSGVKNIFVSVNGSVFNKNGLQLEKAEYKDYFFGGGAIAVAIDIIRLQQHSNFFAIENRHFSISIVGCSVSNNRAYAGGGLVIYSYHQLYNALDDIPEVSIDNSTFKGNMAMLGAAMYIEDTRKHGGDLGIGVLLGNVVIADNHVVQYNHHFSIRDTSAAVFLVSTALVITGHTTIANTNGTGLEALSTLIVILDTLTVAGNQGVYGGGIKVVDYSVLLLQEYSNLTIVNNKAILNGGGIYVDFLEGSPTIIDADCFLYFGHIDVLSCESAGCVDFESFTVHLQIADNNAQQGKTVYGSTLETCPWANNQNNVFELLNEYFILDSEKDNKSLNTRAIRISAKEDLTLFYRMPGQEFELDLQAVDKFNHSVPVLVTVGTLHSDQSDYAKLGNTGYHFLDGSDNNVVPITAYGRPGETINFTIYMTNSYNSSMNLRVKLQECVPGFRYSSMSHVCECIPELMEHKIQCNVNDASIHVPDGTWIGPLNSLENSYTIEDLVVHDCLFNFCKTGPSIVVNGSFETQCNGNNRQGLLCSRCAEGYSLALRGFDCHKCSNYNLFLVLYFIIVGIVSVAILAILEINLATGFLNGFILFEHIGHIYSYDLIPYIGQKLQPFELFNSNCVFEICFFDGMKEFDRTILSFGYPIYLFGIIVSVYFAAKKITAISKMGFAITKAFATLLILVYVLVTEVCVRVLAFIQVETLSGTKLLRWRYDPEVKYFTGLHIAMAAISILILFVYVIPLPFLLLFPERLYKMKCTNYFKPLFDAFWNPFKPRHRYWLGLRLILRIPLFLIATLVPPPLHIFLALLFLFILITIQVHVKPFQGKWQNFTDILFLSILVLLFMIALFFQSDSTNETHYVIAIVVAVMAYIVMIPIVIYHLFLKYPNLKQPFVNLSRKSLLLRTVYFKIRPKRDSKVDLQKNDCTKSLTTLSSVVIKTPVTNTPVDIAEEFRGLETIITHTVYREPLLDEGELEIEASYSSRILRTTSDSLSSSLDTRSDK